MSDPVVFEAVIRPHRSLSAQGLRRLSVAIGAICLFAGLRFWAAGAWPVAAFAAIELPLALYLLYLNNRRGRASETITLTQTALSIVRISHDGVRRGRSLAPDWLNVRLTERPGRTPELALERRGTSVEIAMELNEDEKRDLGAALKAALARRRSPEFDNPQLRGG